MAGSLEVRAFDITCPPGVDSAVPQITDLDIPVREVLKIRVRVPTGPSSAMGFQLGMVDTPIIPFNDDSFVIADDETFEWDNQGWPDSGAWQVFMYNTGQYPHTIYLYFTVQLPDAQTQSTPATLLPAETLGPPAGSVAPVTTAPTLPPLQLVAS